MKILKNKDGKWCYDFTFEGKRIRRVVGLGKAETEQAMAEKIREFKRNKHGLGNPRPQAPLFFEEFAEDFLNTYSKPNKRERNHKNLLVHLKPFFKRITLSNIGPELIEKYRARRIEAVSPATVNRELALLKVMFNKAVEWGKIDFNPAKGVKKFKENNVKERILTDDETKMLIEAASSHLKPILILLLNTGMRRNECLSLKWENINFSKAFIFIEDSKSGKSRTVPMNSIVFETLKNLKRNSEFVFFNPETKDYIKDIKTAFKTACKRVNIKGLRLHDLRHTAASKMVEAGIDLVCVSKILGHASIQMTTRYAHPTPENMRKAVEKLGEAFRKSLEIGKKLDNEAKKVEAKLPTSYLFAYN